MNIKTNKELRLNFHLKKALCLLLSALMLFIMLSGQKAAAADGNSPGIVATYSTALNVRSSPSLTSTVVKKLSKGSYVTLVSRSGGWWRVEYGKNLYGYCSDSYIMSTSGRAAYVSITSGYLNVRQGAGTSYSVKATLTKGEDVIVLSTSGNWSRILYNGIYTGYVSSVYLSSAPTAVSYTSLSVPDYKQTDSRWSGTYLGSSGKTIGSIGCTTTCLAMVESYRTGTTIYPSAMAKKLSYSSTGSLYWPSNYTTTTNVSYAAVRSLINEGKPVIVGLRTSSYSTHWVVVTGYSGTTFYINDPGTASRTTLGQTMAKYPFFYKMAYYK